MANFEKCIGFTLESEGGEYTNDPNDRGGATKWGIDLQFAKDSKDTKLLDIDGDGDIDKNDIKKLDLATAIKVYKKHFWDKMNLDECPSDKIAYIAFDLYVNHGKKGASKIIQRALNDCGYSLVVDGMYGQKTQSTMFGCNPDKFVNAAVERRIAYYKAIVANNPSQKVFIKGWLNRANFNKKQASKLAN